MPVLPPSALDLPDGPLSALQALTSGSNREFSAYGTGEIAGGVFDTDGDLGVVPVKADTSGGLS